MPDDRADQQYVVPQLSGSVLLDGLSDEAAWESIAPLPFTMHSPTFEGQPAVESEVRIAYDTEYLYIAARCYDRPERIAAISYRRDAFVPTTDLFGIILDSFNDNENGMAFFTTPTGNRIDFTIFNDAEGGDQPDAFPFNLSWDTFWDVAVARNQRGWFVEMRIPLSSLRFQENAGQVVMGFITWRYAARLNEVYIHPAVSPRWGPWSIIKPSRGRDLLITDIRSQKPVYVTPYLLGGQEYRNELDEGGVVYRRINERPSNIGLDVKYSLTSNLTFDGTLNTDFAQVEADAAQVNLTRFSLFFPEKRRFFQERASTFEFNFGGPNRLFYSRRIGLHEEEPVPILGGGRLVGRLAKWDLGLLDMQTARYDALDLPSENFGVLRLRRQIFNPYSYVGGMTTSRIGTNGNANYAFGLDGIIRLLGEEYLTLNWAQTLDDTTAGANHPLDRTRFRAGWERRNYDGLGYDLNYTLSGPAYNPGIGFQMRDDYTLLGTELSYGWLKGEDSPFQSHLVNLQNHLFHRMSNGRLESDELQLSWVGQWKSGTGLQCGINVTYDRLSEVFELSDDATVPPGTYRFYTLNSSYNTPPGNPLSVIAQLQGGAFYDGRGVSISLIPNWNLSRHITMEGFYQMNRFEFPKRNQQFLAHIGRIRLQVTLNVKVTFSTFIQYNSAEDVMITNVRLRYNPREGNDFYLVYNEGLNTDRYREFPFLPRTDNRTILLKYSHTLLF